MSQSAYLWELFAKILLKFNHKQQQQQKKIYRQKIYSKLRNCYKVFTAEADSSCTLKLKSMGHSDLAAELSCGLTNGVHNRSIINFVRYYGRYKNEVRILSEYFLLLVTYVWSLCIGEIFNIVIKPPNVPPPPHPLRHSENYTINVSIRVCLFTALI